MPFKKLQSRLDVLEKSMKQRDARCCRRFFTLLKSWVGGGGGVVAFMEIKYSCLFLYLTAWDIKDDKSRITVLINY